MGAYDWLILSIVVFLVLAIIANAVFSGTKNKKEKQIDQSQNFNPLTENESVQEQSDSKKTDGI